MPGRALIKEADVVVNGNKKTYKVLSRQENVEFFLKKEAESASNF